MGTSSIKKCTRHYLINRGKINGKLTKKTIKTSILTMSKHLNKPNSGADPMESSKK